MRVASECGFRIHHAIGMACYRRCNTTPDGGNSSRAETTRGVKQRDDYFANTFLLYRDMVEDPGRNVAFKNRSQSAQEHKCARRK